MVVQAFFTCFHGPLQYLTPPTSPPPGCLLGLGLGLGLGLITSACGRRNAFAAVSWTTSRPEHVSTYVTAKRYSMTKDGQLGLGRAGQAKLHLGQQNRGRKGCFSLSFSMHTYNLTLSILPIEHDQSSFSTYCVYATYVRTGCLSFVATPPSPFIKGEHSFLKEQLFVHLAQR